MGEPDPKPASSAVDKALDLIEAVVDAGQPVRLAEVARAVGLHRATAYRVLVDLVRRDWIARTDDAYLPGSVIMRMTRLRTPDAIIALARPTLDNLARTTGLMANLQVLEPGGSRVVDVARPARLEMIKDLLGELLQVHRFAGPLALVAALSRDARTPYLLAAEHAGHPLDGPDGLHADITTTEHHGYALIRGRNDSIVASIARAVRHPTTGTPVCALTLVGLDAELPDTRFAELATTLHTATSHLEKAMAT
ncbi:IclR family transcriptional regulator [Amycolatopsis sp. EV170708-02-1]|uniref:IclR family transcriptional regulator n=1 Tax=Amycolatopsis sp. EV170708-02-1 TaxID=2919322 RepID=UPI001F0C5F67|nr:helix-turn-helix domain-containing protein [Amycolatopsis sp. EV170708-02-1]UMP00058.1 helix-turn-helix domain-containing protein [Amycolatopsis sp. EV170708-02-1]